MQTREHLSAFVESLAIPEERRRIVLLELEDHFFEELAELEASGVPRERAQSMALAALGPPDELRRRLVPPNASFQPLGSREAFGTGLRIGTSLAIAFLATAAVTAAAERVWWELTVRGVEPRLFLPLFAAAMCAPIGLHFVLIHPWRLVHVGRRLSGEMWPVVFLTLFAPVVVVSALPLELSGALDRALGILHPLENGDFGKILLGVWALHGIWLSLLFLIAQRERSVA